MKHGFEANLEVSFCNSICNDLKFPSLANAKFFKVSLTTNRLKDKTLIIGVLHKTYI